MPETRVLIQASSGFIQPLRATVCRRRTAIQPFSVIRLRMRAVFAINLRSHSRSITAEAGRRFLNNAKSLKQLRSPPCKSRSTQERVNRPNKVTPHDSSRRKKMHPVAATGTRIISRVAAGAIVPSLSNHQIGEQTSQRRSSGKAPAYITAAIFMFPLPRPRAYALASTGLLAPDLGCNLDYVRECF